MSATNLISVSQSRALQVWFGRYSVYYMYCNTIYPELHQIVVLGVSVVHERAEVDLGKGSKKI